MYGRMKRFTQYFLRGLGSAFIFPFVDQPRDWYRRRQRSDAEAIKGDWERIGADMRIAMRKEARRLGLEERMKERTRLYKSQSNHFRPCMARRSSVVSFCFFLTFSWAS